MFGAVVRAAAGFAFGALLGAFISEVGGFVRPLLVDGLGETHEIVGYVDAFVEWWIFLALLGALMGVLSAGIAESSGRPV